MERYIVSLFAKTGAALSKYRGIRAVDTLAVASSSFLQYLENVNYDFNYNGELRVLKKLAIIEPKCIFDVGANEGKWALFASELYPASEIHGFEILPSTFKKLNKAIGARKNIRINNFGLSNHEGTITVDYSNDSQITTACKIDGLEIHDKYYTEKAECMVKKASSYIRENKIKFIDFIKIDVEGMELEVIKGFESYINMARMIQFEFGHYNITSRNLLFHFYKYLSDHGFLTGRIFPRSVDFSPYCLENERFYGGNYVAVRKEEVKLIDSLKAYG